MSNQHPNRPPELFHWADEVANRLIRQHPNKTLFTLASGITPSGKVHIGNFREVMTVDLVKRALETRGKQTRFIFSWDDYDVFRKVPPNVPQQVDGQELSSFLWKPIVDVPDPFQEANSYAAHHEKNFEGSLGTVGIEPEFLYQSQKYRAAEYGENMLIAIREKEKIKEILNRHRTQPLDSDWWPISVYCDKCLDNRISNLSFDDPYLTYQCDNCEHEGKVDVKIASNVKLLWRIDWPMRWFFEKVDFEPGGKDHSSEGGSFDTAKLISQEIWDYPPPAYLPYDFVTLKGKGGKMSSSKGEVITLTEILEIYEPEIVRWLFASYRNNVEFAIAFDTDVIRVYESYDRLERIYFGLEEISEKKRGKQIRIFELSQINSLNLSKKIAYQPSFRHLVNIVQVHQLNSDRVVAHYQEHLTDKPDEIRLRNRIKCVINWLEKYASEEFIFSINEQKVKNNPSIAQVYYSGVTDLIEKLNSGLHLKNEVEVSEELYRIIEKFNLNNEIFFKLLYQMLISKNQGPKLGKFIKNIDLVQLNLLLG